MPQLAVSLRATAHGLVAVCLRATAHGSWTGAVSLRATALGQRKDMCTQELLSGVNVGVVF